MSFGTRAPVLALLILLSGCVGTPLSTSLLGSPPAGLSATARLAHVPFFPQSEYQCGPAALATVLSATGITITPTDLVSRVYVPEKHGSYQLEMVTAARSHDRLAYLLDSSLKDLLNEIQAGNPVLVLQNLGLKIAPQWHFAVVKGYDLANKTITLNSGTIENYELSMKIFERTWARGNYWSLVITAPGNLPVTATPQKTFSALTALEHSSPDGSSLSTYYRNASIRWPQNTNLQIGYGNVLHTRGDLAGAEQVFYDVASSNPEFAPAFNNLAFVLYEQERFREAIIYADRAVELGGEFIDSYRETQSLITSKILSF